MVFHEDIFHFHKIHDNVSTLDTDFLQHFVLPQPLSTDVFDNIGVDSSKESTSHDDFGSSSMNVASMNDNNVMDSTVDASDLIPDTSMTADLPRRSGRTRNSPKYLVDYHCNFLKANNMDQSGSYSLGKFLSYDRFAAAHRHSILYMTTEYEPSYFHQIVRFSHWRDAMDE